jgi:hypothetical protein
MIESDAKLLKEHIVDNIPSWDTFVSESANAAIDMYGDKYNKWALYIPALISELTHDVGTLVGMMSEESTDQMSFMDTLEPTTVKEDELPEEQEVKDRMRQLMRGPSQPISMDPFRDLQVEANTKDLDPSADPDLIV